MKPLFVFLSLIILSIFLNAQEVETTRLLKKIGDTVKLVEDQYFRILDGDTINKIDELGMLQGEWERLHPNGDFKCRGRYKDGKKDGYWERKYPNGNWQYQVHMKEGYSHGYAKFYYKNGKLKKEGNYIMGFPDGLMKSYNENGNILIEETYENAEKNGVKKALLGVFPSNFDTTIAQKSIKGVKIDGLVENSAAQRSGLEKGDVLLQINKDSLTDYLELIRLTYLFQLGDVLQIKLLRNFKEKELSIKLTESDFETIKAVLHGQSNYYDENGKLELSGKYEKGKRDGEWKFYDENEKLINVVIYKEGNAIETKSVN